MSENQNQGCIKCGHTEIEEGTLSATGSGLSKFLDVQHNNFKTITCKIVDIPNFINKIETEVETLLICSLEDKSKNRTAVTLRCCFFNLRVRLRVV